MNDKLRLFLAFLGVGVLALLCLIVKDYLEGWALKEWQKKHEDEIQKAKIEEEAAHKKAQKILDEVTQVQNNIERKNEIETQKVREQVEKAQKEAKQILEEANIEASRLRTATKKACMLEQQRIETERENAQKKSRDVLEQAEKQAGQLQNEISQKQENLEELKKSIEKLSQNAFSVSPYFAGMYADYQFIYDQMVAESLEKKVRPAPTAAENIRKISVEKRKLLDECKQYEYKIAALYSLFPWIEDYYDFSVEEKQQKDKWQEICYNDDPVSEYLSKVEWISMSKSNRDQLALDRYIKSHKKTKWQVGRDYELYVGYAYTKKGYFVEYPGSLLRLEDMGRDLIARKDFKTIIIQCKYWAEKKVVHEKHIFQLYGTSVCYKMDHPFEEVQCLLVTNAKFSERAEEVAKQMGVTLVAGFQMGDFPRIKCNINNGEKIYHLPMDQQYDNVIIKNPGEKYAFTVLEAEAAGFRRAYRWSGR